MTDLAPAHQHANEGQPVIIVHARRDAAISESNPAHAFGPFASQAAANLWNAAQPDGDECYKFTLDLYDPFEMNGA